MYSGGLFGRRGFGQLRGWMPRFGARRRSSYNNSAIALAAGGSSLGALFMFMFDPDMGKRRRALVRDKMIRAQHATADAMEVTARDLRNRVIGMMSEARCLFSSGDVGDEILAERVRAKMGFLVRHPSSIEVGADNGRVMLSGPILADEVGRLIKKIRSIPGVRDVDNRLEVHEEPGSVPGLQGGKEKPRGERIDLLQSHWAPSTRFLLGSAGTALIAYGANQRNGVGASAALAGAGLIAGALLTSGIPGGRRRHPRGAVERNGDSEDARENIAPGA